MATAAGQISTKKQRGFRLLSDLPMEPSCKAPVGLTTNEAVVCFEGQRNIQKITFDGNRIIVLKESTLPPHDMKRSCMKYILNNNNVLLRNWVEGPSYILNSHLNFVFSIIIEEDYGDIIGAESTHWVAFEKYNTIQIYDLEQKQLLQTLRGSAGMDWRGSKSICRHPDSQGTAVVACNSSSLCIFDHDGRHVHTYKLQYTAPASLGISCNLHFWPHRVNAIACNRRHLYVVSRSPSIDYEEGSVFVYSWSGQFVTKLDIEPKGQVIHNIAVNEDQFTIAVGDRRLVRSFKTFQCV